MTASDLRAARLAALERKNKKSITTAAGDMVESSKTEQQPLVRPQASPAASTPKHFKKSTKTSSLTTTNKVIIETQDIDPRKFNIDDFNSLMWDDFNNTTAEDKTRWFSQGIHTKLLLQNKNNVNDESSTANVQPSNDFDSWGLLQSFGGPCGVLAALQAELISRLLIYEKIQEQDSHSLTRFDSKEIEQALADCIANILVRSCMAPSIHSKSKTNDVDGDGYEEKGMNYCVKLILPKTKLSDEQQQQQQNSSFLDPSILQCVSIKIDDEGDDTVTNTPEAKRAKQTNKVSNDKGHSSSSHSVRDMVRNRLCEATSEYFLSKGTNTNDNTEDLLQLELFYHYAGVMLLTMSLVATRGVDRIQSGE